jgi:hypothetical protein
VTQEKVKALVREYKEKALRYSLEYKRFSIDGIEA